MPITLPKNRAMQADASTRGEVIAEIMSAVRAQIDQIEASYPTVFSLDTPSDVKDNFRFACKISEALEKLGDRGTLDITMGAAEFCYSAEEDRNWFPTCGYLSELEKAEISYKGQIGRLEEQLSALRGVGVEVVTGFVATELPEVDGLDEEVEERWSPAPAF